MTKPEGLGFILKLTRNKLYDRTDQTEVVPVNVSKSSMIQKTSLNERLIDYTFELAQQMVSWAFMRSIKMSYFFIFLRFYNSKTNECQNLSI